MTLLECSNLTKKYCQRLVLSDLSLRIEQGRIIGLLGPNGSGKTTLIKLIAGLLVPSQGQILVKGGPIGIESKNAISYLPDYSCLSDWMKVNEVIRLFQDFYKDFDASRAYDMLDKLQIDPTEKLKTMSKGTKEKVQLILVMSRHADLYLLDEPIGGVDPATRDFILKTIISNYEETASVILSTHLISDIENILDEVILINKGSIHIHSSVDELRAEHNKSIDALFREVYRC